MCAFVLRPGQAGGYFQSCSALLDTMPQKGTAPKRRCSLQNHHPQLSTVVLARGSWHTYSRLPAPFQALCRYPCVCACSP